MTKPQSEERQPQGIPSTPRRRKPPPKPPIWDQAKAIDLASRGVNQRDIASTLGIHVNTVHRYLQRIKPEMEQIQTFKDQTGNVLALTLARCCSILDKLLIYYDNEDVLGGLSPTERERLLGRVAIAAGITFDKLRLHEGKATRHLSHQIQLTEVHKSLTFGPMPSESGNKTD